MEMEKDESSLEQYERRLFEAWCAFEAEGGPLSRAAARALCEALQLGRRGEELVDRLFQGGERGGATFAQFRAGLLAVLGAGEQCDPALTAAPQPASDGDEEAAPRLVLGAKRYGRRSRPPRAAPPAAPLRHDAPVDAARALQLCRGLHMDGVDPELVERIFEAAPEAGTTVGEFFDRLNVELGSMAGAAPSEGAADGQLSGELVLEAWERGGVQEPGRLLRELGFEGARLDGGALEAALERELAAAGEEGARALLLRAALAVSRLRAARARQLGAAERDGLRAERDGLRAERDGLRAELQRAERRARAVAQEADEGAARLERELEGALRRAGERHQEELRRAQGELAAERERAQAERAGERAEAARRRDGEARLRAEAEAAAGRAVQLEARAAALEQRALAAEGERARLAERVRELQCAPPADSGDEALRAALAQSRAEAAALRDRCDELAALLEPRAPPAAPAPPAPSLLDEEPSLGTSHRLQQQCDSLSSGVAETEVEAEPEKQQTLSQSERDKFTETIRELESALEAMREEYERCEEYWGGKLRDERELAASEQRAQDERLAELLARVQEYERRCRLPAIPEAGEELEHELATARRELAAARDELVAAREEHGRELATLRVECGRELAALRQAHARELQRRDSRLRRARLLQAAAGSGAECGAAGRGDCAALRARLQQAEVAAARLSARLAAADLLVKELYVENCMLAPAALRI